MTESKYTKAEIVDSIYNKTGINRKEIRDMMDLLIDEIKDALQRGHIIELRGFGTFEIKIRKGRKKARNPKTGESVSSNAHGIVSFRAGRDLKQDVWNLQQENESPAQKSS
jgi:integration host factor subunit beta